MYQKWPDQISPVVNFVFSRNGHFGLGRGGGGFGGGPPPLVFNDSKEALCVGLSLGVGVGLNATPSPQSLSLSPPPPGVSFASQGNSRPHDHADFSREYHGDHRDVSPGYTASRHYAAPRGVSLEEPWGEQPRERSPPQKNSSSISERTYLLA